MDTWDIVGLIASFIGAVVFFEFGSITMAGYDLASSIGYSIAGSPISYALALSFGGVAFMLATNQLNDYNDGLSLDTMEIWGIALGLGPTFLVWWNQNAADYVQGDYTIAGVAVLISLAGYVMVAAAPQMYMSN
jgi:hypothetical protein